MLGVYLALIDTKNGRADFRRLYDENKHKAFCIAYSITGNVALAEDSVAEAFLNIARTYKKISGLSEDMKKAYIYRTVKNCAINVAKKESKAETKSFDTLLACEEPSIEFFNDVEHETLFDIIRELDDKYQTVLTYKVVYGLSSTEISKIMNVSRRTVFNYYDEAKRIIAEKLNIE